MKKKVRFRQIRNYHLEKFEAVDAVGDVVRDVVGDVVGVIREEAGLAPKNHQLSPRVLRKKKKKKKKMERSLRDQHLLCISRRKG